MTTCNTSTRTSISTNPKFKRPLARTNSLYSLFYGRSATMTGRSCLAFCVFTPDTSPTKRWQGRAEGRRLGVMTVTISSGSQHKKNGWTRVLGVDPAAAGPTGYGIVESDGRRCRMLHYGAFKVSARRQKECSGATLQDVHALMCALLDQFSPDALAVESVFTALNMRTALRLAEVRGVVLLAAAQRGVAVHSYSPREVKASVAGYGQADKRQMQLMVRGLLAM